jgi:hypothetical protein
MKRRVINGSVIQVYNMDYELENLNTLLRINIII